MGGKVGALAELVAGKRLAVLTGAGCSTESGIPDYRGPSSRHRPRQPIQHREFVHSESIRRRYWARSAIGWRLMAAAQPNSGHRALAALEARGHLRGLITQNVDRLHRAAGSRQVIELHGALAEVICLVCGDLEARHRLQARLLELNPEFPRLAFEHAPDGDAELPDELVSAFRVPGCASCGGTLKPHVVFFGGSVPRPVVERAAAIVDGADALLVVGSSLQVFSGFRFARRAAQRGLPIAIINLGPSRADDLASLVIDAPAGEVLPALAAALGDSAPRS
jgi:NAD+-dependent protein deacetylase sirtuin 4